MDVLNADALFDFWRAFGGLLQQRAAKELALFSATHAAEVNSRPVFPLKRYFSSPIPQKEYPASSFPGGKCMAGILESI